MEDGKKIDDVLSRVTARLLGECGSAGFWTGELSSSALAGATAVFALKSASSARDSAIVRAGVSWLTENSNADGGWGDSPKSPSNISASLLAWSVVKGSEDESRRAGISRAEGWIESQIGEIKAENIVASLEKKYGQDRTFAVPILTMLALSGQLGEGAEAWKVVPPIPFELALCPNRILRFMDSGVVSYALPALIAMGLVREHFLPSENPMRRLVRRAARSRMLKILSRIQPSSGGFLEAVPLTAFVVMSLSAMGLSGNSVVRRGLGFIRRSVRSDGSWPIDTNLSTWVTTLSVGALGDCEEFPGRD